MSPFIRWGSRPISLAVLIAAPLAFILQGEARADTCSCSAHFELRAPSNGRPDFDPSFKPDVPVDHFTAGLDQGAGTINGCRRQAQHRAHGCMNKIWENRWPAWQDTGNYKEPSECSTSRGIHGSVPYNIKWWIERAACQSPSPIANRIAEVAVFRRTHGGTGCGDDLKTVKSVFVSNYEVDCLAIRNREKLGMVAETQVEGIDRPGSDLGPGSNVGDGSVGACKAACNLHSNCRAWTWVPPGGQGPESKCWVKSAVPWFKRHATSAKMVSGTRQHDSQ